MCLFVKSTVAMENPPAISLGGNVDYLQVNQFKGPLQQFAELSWFLIKASLRRYLPPSTMVLEFYR